MSKISSSPAWHGEGTSREKPQAADGHILEGQPVDSLTIAQSPARYCSISCKIESILSIGTDLSSDEVVKQLLTHLNSTASTMLAKSGRSTALVSC